MHFFDSVLSQKERESFVQNFNNDFNVEGPSLIFKDSAISPDVGPYIEICIDLGHYFLSIVPDAVVVYLLQKNAGMAKKTLKSILELLKVSAGFAFEEIKDKLETGGSLEISTKVDDTSYKCFCDIPHLRNRALEVLPGIEDRIIKENDTLKLLGINLVWIKYFPNKNSWDFDGGVATQPLHEGMAHKYSYNQDKEIWEPWERKSTSDKP